MSTQKTASSTAKAMWKVFGRLRSQSSFPKSIFTKMPLVNRAPHIDFVNFDRNAPVLGHMGDLEVRLVRSLAEIEAAQHLRYQVFYEELHAEPDARARATRRDIDEYDTICDHLVVLDTSRSQPSIVATYRLLRQEIAQRFDGFYSASEFSIEPWMLAHPDKRFLELGRSCVLREYRNKRTIELLWQGTWAYILQHKMDVLFGCASLEGTRPEKLVEPLSFLTGPCAAENEWEVQPLPHLAAKFEAIPADAIDMRRAMRALPPLMKGYLRLGAKISKGAVVDHQFGTTDVMIVMPVADLNPSYVNYYGADASRYSA